MSTSVKSQVMKSAWRMFRQFSMTFSRALVLAWDIQKEIDTEEKRIFNVNKSLNLILNRLSPNTNTETSSSKGTIVWYSFKHSKKIKTCKDPEVLEMFDHGIIPNADILNFNKRHSRSVGFVPKKEKTRRPRIFPKNPIRVSVEEYLQRA